MNYFLMKKQLLTNFWNIIDFINLNHIVGPIVNKWVVGDYEYLLKFCDVVGKHAKEKQDCCKADLVIRRRDSMKKNDDEGY